MTDVTSFDSTVTVDDHKGGWTYVLLPDSGALLGTRNTLKVTATIAGESFDATLMPSGTGAHMLPLRAAVRKALGVNAGDPVTADIRIRVAA